MKLYHYRGDRVGPNFGDELNNWLWPRVIPDAFDDDESELFLGIGTIVAQWVPDAPKKIVLGSGTSPAIAPNLDSSWRILAVRGPLTAKILQLDGRFALTDPAVLVGNFFRPKPLGGNKVTVMLHHARSKRANWRLACALAGLEYLDPHDDVQHLLERIARSRLVLAEAMHAAIVADALRIPWIPIKVHDHIDAFKWRDWCASMELEYQPAEILPLLSGSPALHRRLQSKLLPYLLGSKLRRIARDNATFLSSDGVLERQKDRLLSLTRDVS